ncbi:hypothetical protein FC820_10480 [Clostridium sporogenes]|uniref:hypothetical protein n=1 Tax=Clostridium sporogenes TaxID=1509 RepID=UPI0013D6E535|nr:hypothetical protein [Clostridium sporogenes]EJE7236252.1 hypothetical protein [Clostridium botulinum]NFE80230.1 hypothetical protein [Clostridium sporogenes]NFG68736.1 hypothetical protein [Clostridium sporogenes]
MKIIKYFNRILVGEETKYKIEKYIDYELIDGEIKEVIKERKVPYTEYQFEIQPQTFECEDEELDQYLEHITKTYGQYGEVTVEHKEVPPKEPDLKEQIEQQSKRLDEQNKAMAEMMNLIAMQGIAP